jgi:Fur family ferric uptake transcriptional regulator
MNQVQVFNDFINRKGLKTTSQRMIILEAFLGSDCHFSTEELYLKLREEFPKIGYATVHRTLKLFAECGIAAERHFGDGQTRYEPVKEAEHHDHLVCTECGLIIEFEEPQIEQLQEKVAAAHHFQIATHRLELYGLCAGCQNS